METRILLPESTRRELPDGMRVTWGVRPEYVEWSADATAHAVGGQVHAVENLGAQNLLTMRSGESRLQAVIGKDALPERDRKSTRLNSSHMRISYAVFCLKKKKNATVFGYYVNIFF